LGINGPIYRLSEELDEKIRINVVGSEELFIWIKSRPGIVIVPR
jgi:hypothetical protein